MYLQEGLTKLQSYVMHELAKQYEATQPKGVFVGDIKAFGHFKKNHLTDLVAGNRKQGIFYQHPNKKGAAALGQYWGKAIMNCIKKAGYN